MAFDPTKFGAVPVESSSFDPSSFGAMAVPNAEESVSTSIWNKLSGGIQTVFPGKKIGEALGGSFAAIGRLAQGDIEGFQNIARSQPTPLEVGGDVARAVALPGSLISPIPKAATILGTAGKAAFQTGVIGAISGAGSAASEGGDVGDIARGAFYSGLTSAAIGGIAGAFTKIASNLVKKTPEALYNNALKTSLKLKEAGKSPAEFLADEGTWGGLGSIRKTASEGIAKESGTITSKIANRISTEGDVITTFNDVKNQAAEKLIKQLGGTYSQAEVKQMIDGIPIAALRDTKEGIGLVELNDLRSKLGSLLGDSKWLQDNPTQSTKAARTVYNILSGIIKDNTGTATEFSRLSRWIQTQKVVDKTILKADSKFGLGLYDLIAGSTGATAGAFATEGDPLQRLKNALIGGAVGIGIERSLGSTAIKTGIAQLIKQIDGLPTDTAGKVSRTAVTQLIGELIGQSSK